MRDQLANLDRTIWSLRRASLLGKPAIAELAVAQAVELLEVMARRIHKLEVAAGLATDDEEPDHE